MAGRMLPRPTVRGTLVLAGAVGALGAAFSAGVVAGAAGSDPEPAVGVLDAAAARIAGSALAPVDRTALEAAAVDAMLSAAGDPWGTWSTAPRSSRLRTAPQSVTVSEAPGTVSIRVAGFPRGTGAAVRTAVAAAGSRGVVLDLRGNRGGLLDEAVQTASAFLDGGSVVSYARRDGETVRLDAAAAGNARVPLVVLVDGGTASAAEVVAGALQDRGRAVVVGSRTYGKGTVQEPQTLSDGSALDLTVARYRTPAGRSLEGAGLEPDVEVPPGQPVVAERRAVEVLFGLVADSGQAR